MERQEAGFPPFPHSLEIPLGFPHYHGLDDWIVVFSCLKVENRDRRKGLVTDVSGPQRNACPGTLKETTVINFLTNHAIRVSDDFGYDEDFVHGVDWTSTYSSPPGKVENISAPLLLMGMTGSWEYLASETIYGNAKSSDKTLAFVEGASHIYSTSKQCEKSPGQFGDTQKTTYDYIDKWLSKKGRL